MDPITAFTGSATTWAAGDVSSGIASGAAQVTARFKNTSDSPIILHVRKTGSSDDIPFEILPGFYTADITLGLTAAETIDYYIEGGGSISCDVVDYAGTLASSASAFTGTATTWTAIDLSNDITAGSTEAKFRFNNTSGSALILHLRGDGASDDFVFEIQPGFYTADITLAITPALEIDYYVEGGGTVDYTVVSYEVGTGTTTYTTEAKVASLLRLINTSTNSRLTFSASTDPTLAEVTTLILRAEDDIDQATGHAWRARTITNEYHNISGVWSGESQQEIPIKLLHRSIRAMTSGTDKIEYWDGSSWIEMVATLTEGRRNDYWVDYTNGFVYFCDTKPQYENKGVRVTYRFGETTVPGDIEEAVTKLAAINILENDDYKILIPEGSSDRYSLMSKVENWKKRIEKIIDNRREIQAV